MAFGPESTNPRARRAYAHAVRARANANPTAEMVTAALKQDIVLAHGPLKSRRMAGAVSVRAVLADYHVVFRWDDFSMTERAGDTTTMRRPATGEHLGGVVTKDAMVAPTDRSPFDPNDPRVMCGIHRADRLTDPRLAKGGAVPLLEALTKTELLEHGWDLYGLPYDIAGDSVSHLTLRQAAAVIIQRELPPGLTS